MPDNNGSGNAVLEGVDGVIKVADAIKKVKDALDVINPGRSVIMSVFNSTNQQMILTQTSFDHGNWGAGNQDAQYIYQIFQQPAPFGAMLVNKHIGMALDVPGFSTDDNVLIQQYPMNGGVNQRWIFTKIGGDGPNSIYSLTNQGSQKCMDVPDGSADPQVRIQQYSCHGGPNQQWRFGPAEGGFFVIYNVNSGLCLDIPGLSTDWGTIVQQFGFNNGTNQKWRVQWQ